MAAPPPKPVEPIFSRALRLAAIDLAGRPVSFAAAAASCWNSAYLFAATMSASIALSLNITERSLIIAPVGRPVPPGERAEGAR